MLRTMLKSKIHRATVTHADLHYVGSVTIDADLMDAADLLEGEQVTIVDVDNGVDVYVSSRALTTSFLSKRNLKHVDSYTLHTEKQGKRLYRSTYAVKV